MKIFCFAGLILLVLWGLWVFSLQEVQAVDKEEPILSFDAEATFRQVCLACHFAPKGPVHRGARVAPPVFAIKQHYLEHFKDKDLFVAAMVRFLMNPKSEEALMPGAVERFGLMNRLPYTSDQWRALAEVMFTMDVPVPQRWEVQRWKHCQKKPSLCAQTKERAARIRQELSDP